MKPFLVFLNVFFLAHLSLAQEVFTLKTTAEPTRPKPSRMPIFLMEYYTNPIVYDGKELNIELPPLEEDKPKAFGFLFFEGNKSNPQPGEVLVLLYDYEDYQGKLYVDKNFNLDLRDDGLPITFTDSTDLHHIKLSHSDFPRSVYSVDIQYIRFKNDRQESMVAQMRADDFPHLQGNTFIPYSYWLTETRNNYLIFRDVLGSDTVKLTLVDDNFNGLYNDVGADRILVADGPENQLLDRPGKNNYMVGDATPLSINNSFFQIDEISPYGSLIKLRNSSAEVYDHYHKSKLIEGAIIPDLTFSTFEEQEMSIHQAVAPQGLTLFDFWGTWCKGCIEQTSQLKQLDKRYGDRLTIVGLNYQSDTEKAAMYVEDQQIDWMQGIADKALVKAMAVDSFPFYILVNKDRSIHTLGIRLNELEKNLEQ